MFTSLNVLVYAGPEVLQTSLAHTVAALRHALFPHYSVQTISHPSLASQPWAPKCALLVFPSCRDYFFSATVPTIKSYVENGGAFLGLGMGATSRCRSRSLEQGALPTTGSSLTSGDRTLCFFDNGSGAYVTPTFCVRTETSIRSVVLKLNDGQRIDTACHGSAPEFLGFDGTKMEILARYAKDEGENAVAAVNCDVSKGKAILWATSVEYPLTTEPMSVLLSSNLSTEEIGEAEKKRQTLFHDTLRGLGLHVPSPGGCTVGGPLPQFLVSHPMRPTIIPQILGALAYPSQASQLSIFEDAHDTFHFHPLSQSAILLQKIRASPAGENDPKHIILSSDGALPALTQTPLFDLDLYFRSLSKARIDEELPEHSEPWGVGDALLYGEVVTSTQTLFEKNPRLLSLLPAPILSVASHQLAGRGRGSNVWLSPSGSLSMTLLLRVPLSGFPVHKLVFVQYLFSLALVEACRDDAIMGRWGRVIRLKWPNDVYAVVGEGDDEGVKIGGILVNSSFGDGYCSITIGCGVNFFNDRPATSISQLVPEEVANALSMERGIAVIIAKFEKMWNTFIAHRGSFEPFMDLYLERWLHSDQLVTLTSVPPQQVRIMGISPEYGLLRTVPEKGGAEFIDLQPDGNSFDMMVNMIRTRSQKPM